MQEVVAIRHADDAWRRYPENVERRQIRDGSIQNFAYKWTKSTVAFAKPGEPKSPGENSKM